jgi:hypothetical protein
LTERAHVRLRQSQQQIVTQAEHKGAARSRCKIQRHREGPSPQRLLTIGLGSAGRAGDEGRIGMFKPFALDEEHRACPVKLVRDAQGQPQQELSGGVLEAFHSEVDGLEVQGRARRPIELAKGLHRAQLVGRPAI